MKKHLFIIIVSILSSINVFGEIRIRDNFEYEATRTGTGAEAFVLSGGWTAVKAINSNNSGTRGYLYTATSIPGFVGVFPGSSSSSVACFEFLPETMGDQTDVYLHFGGDADDTVPANVWFQYWIYPQRYGSQMSRLYNLKWLYPSRTGDYPASESTGLDWLVIFKEFESSWLYWNSTSPGNTFHDLNSYGYGYDQRAVYELGESWDNWKMGENISSGLGVLPANTWTLVKINIDTSGSSPVAPIGQGVWRMWYSSDGAAFTKVTEWIGGVTPNFTWPITNSQGGHKCIRIGTTANDYDSWIYLDDFVIATSEADLPTYSADETAPTVSSASIASNGETVTINFSESVVTTGYDDGDFNLDCTAAGNDIALNSISGSGSTRTFSAASIIGAGDSCNLDYTGGANEIEDAAGNDLATFSNTSVTNYSTQLSDNDPPEVSTAVIGSDGLTVTITFNEVVVTTGYDAGDFNLDCNTAGQNISLSSPSGSGTSRTFTAETLIYQNDLCNLDYIGGADDITDTVGNDMATFSNTSVTDNSAVQFMRPVRGVRISNGAGIR